MNEVRVPEEWQRRKKIKFVAISISITIAVLFILLSI
jgi:hypothetical protein